jgi:hypothetical protein
MKSVRLTMFRFAHSSTKPPHVAVNSQKSKLLSSDFSRLSFLNDRFIFHQSRSLWLQNPMLMIKIEMNLNSMAGQRRQTSASQLAAF